MNNQKIKKTVFPYRWLWTWDHCTNWNLDYDGQLDWGANNEYLKPPEAFLDDYKRLIDAAVRYNVNGIIIWGFLRDKHGGIAAAQKLCKYANERGVRILPGIGTSEYGGFYYRGNHTYNTDTWLSKHPECATPDRYGKKRKLCPTHPENIKWLKAGTRWLFNTFDIGGINLEYGDFSVCSCMRCKQARESMAGNDPDYYKDMLASVMPVIDEARKFGKDKWISYATYTGFLPSSACPKTGDSSRRPQMQKDIPLFVKKIPESIICQWTISGMIHTEKVPLMTFLDKSDPKGFKSRNWPAGLKPPTKTSIGFIHQGNQWFVRGHQHTRYSVEIAAIKEACLRACNSGIKGLIIHGEVSDRCVPNELNYSAFSYFTSHPRNSLREFAKDKLTPLCGGKEMAVKFMEFLARGESGILKKHELRQLDNIFLDFQKNTSQGKNYREYCRWRWLRGYIENTNMVICNFKKTNGHWTYF